MWACARSTLQTRFFLPGSGPCTVHSRNSVLPSSFTESDDQRVWVASILKQDDKSLAVRQLLVVLVDVWRVHPIDSWSFKYALSTPYVTQRRVGRWFRTKTFNPLKTGFLLNYIQEVLVGRTNRPFSLIRHGQHWKRCVQQFFYCGVCIHYRANVSTEPLPSNDRGATQTRTNTQTSMWFHKPTMFIQNKGSRVIRIQFVPHRKHITPPLQNPTG
jgi:hypothetical protein